MKSDDANKKKKGIKSENKKTESDQCCCHIVDSCGCFVDPCGCYVDTCGYYASRCCC